MTEVRFRYVRPTPSGVDEPLSFRNLELSLEHRESADGAIRVVQREPVQLDAAGRASVRLSPTSAAQGWRIRERWPNGLSFVVAVPDREWIDAADLVILDPSSLEPAATPSPSWALGLEALGARVDALAANGIPPSDAAIEAALEAVMGSGGQLHVGAGAPTFIAGAKVGDFYLDSVTGRLHQLETGA